VKLKPVILSYVKIISFNSNIFRLRAPIVSQISHMWRGRCEIGGCVRGRCGEFELSVVRQVYVSRACESTWPGIHASRTISHEAVPGLHRYHRHPRSPSSTSPPVLSFRNNVSLFTTARHYPENNVSTECFAWTPNFRKNRKPFLSLHLYTFTLLLYLSSWESFGVIA